MLNDEFIEVHKRRGKYLDRVMIRKDKILFIKSWKRGASINFLLHADWVSFACVFCIESYDEVVALLNK